MARFSVELLISGWFVCDEHTCSSRKCKVQNLTAATAATLADELNGDHGKTCKAYGFAR